MPEILRRTLKNGLVIIAEKRPNTEGMASIHIGVKVGNGQEDSETQGISHLIEHLAFKSQGKRHFEEIIKNFNHNGIDFDAGASRNIIDFEAEAPCEHLSLVLKELYRAVKNTNYNLEEVKREKDAILSEISYRKDKPVESCLDSFFSILFRGTPFAKPILGIPKSIRKLSRRKLVKFKNMYFRPNNMVIAVCGKFDEQELFRAIKKTFGRLRRRKVPFPEIKIPDRKNYCRTSVLKRRKGIASIYLTFGHLIPGFNHPDAPKLILLNSILCDGLSSKLYLKLMQARGLGYKFGGSIDNLGGFSAFFFNAQIGNPSRFLEAKRLILEEIKKIRGAPLEDLEGYKSWLISQLKRELADINYRAEQSLDSEVENWAFDFRKLPEIINKITAQEIQEAAQKYLTDDYTLVALVPWGFRIRKKHKQ